MRFHSQKTDGGYAIAHAAIPVLFGVRAEVTADNTSIRVSWEWLCQDCWCNEGGFEMNYTVGSTTATSATLLNLQCNTKYTIWVYYFQSLTGHTSVL